jgi:TRAP-type uncharacterized transport system substrate-binding protein
VLSTRQWLALFRDGRHESRLGSANETLSQLDQLRYKRIAIGTPGQGVRAFLEPLLAANNVTGFNSQFVPLGNVEALHALQEGKVDVVCLLGAVRSPAVFQALHDRTRSS